MKRKPRLRRRPPARSHVSPSDFALRLLCVVWAVHWFLCGAQTLSHLAFGVSSTAAFERVAYLEQTLTPIRPDLARAVLVAVLLAKWLLCFMWTYEIRRRPSAERLLVPALSNTGFFLCAAHASAMLGHPGEPHASLLMVALSVLPLVVRPWVRPPASSALQAVEVPDVEAR